MGISRGTNIITDNLVLGFDAGYGVADKNTSTRFYKGRPTTNEINLANDDLNNWSSYDNGNDGTFTTEFGTVGVKINNRTSWNGLYKFFTLPSTGTYTFSAWFRYRGGTSSNNGATVYISSYGGSDTATALDKSKIGEWQRVTKTVNATDVTIYFYLISYGGTQSGGSPDKSSWDVTMPQIEKLSDETPFVNGSRSNTNTLIDLKRNKTLDISNLSFDGDGQPEFDGTNDVIAIDSITLGNGAFTIDAVIDADAHGYNLLSNSSGGPVTNGFGTNNNRIFYRHYNGSWVDRQGTSTTVSLNTKTHLTWVNRTGGTMDMYVNGVKDSVSGFSSTTTNGGPVNAIGRNWFSYWNGHIYTFKYYNEAFTDAEVLRQFNAYKNRFNL